jgi:hypothetical protein
MSEIVNVAWGCDTLFSRFSECQRIFEREFRLLLSRFEEYSQYVREATVSGGISKGGVYREEFNTLPFWYHCDCGSKVRLIAEQQRESLYSHGECLRCGKRHETDFSSKKDPEISGILHRISARSLAMPLVFFDGLRVCCYVGGVGGKVYLRQAKYVAEGMDMSFPPVVIWRPRDVYFGVGQLEALVAFRKLAGTFDISRFPEVKNRLKEKITSVQKKIDELELKKKELAEHAEMEKEEMIDKMKAVSVRQREIRRDSGFSVLSRNLKLLHNVKAAMRLYPCIVDYAANIGLKSTNDQWRGFLKKNGSLASSISLETDFGRLVQCVGSEFGR